MVIYMFTNRLDNKKYIGQTINPVARIKGHIHNALVKLSDKGSSVLLYRAIRKYGIESFIIEILYSSSNEVLISNLEKYFIALMSTCNRDLGYNISKGGTGGDTFTYDSEENKIKRKGRVSEFHTGRHHSEETKLKISLAQKGKPRPVSSREKWAKRKENKDYCSKLSNATKQYYANLTPEEREKRAEQSRAAFRKANEVKKQRKLLQGENNV